MPYDVNLVSKPPIESIIETEGISSLTRIGKKMKGLCPFHNEKTPSFIVNTEKQRYHCFGCGENGDVIQLIRKYHHLSFRDALKHLGLAEDNEVLTEKEKEAILQQREQQRKEREALSQYRVHLIELDVKLCRLYRNYKELTMKGVETWEDVENRSWIFHRLPLWKHLLGMLRIVLDSRNTPDQNDPGLQSLVRAVEKELDKFKFEERLIHFQECRFLMS